MTFLLVGGVGYVGGRLASFLRSRGHAVHITTRRPAAGVPPWIQADRILQADPRDRGALASSLEGVDVVVYLAGADQSAAAREPLSALRVAAEGTWNLMEAVSERARPPAVVYVSTFHVYGRNLSGTVTEATLPVPVHPYALARRIGEEIIETFRGRGAVKSLSVRLSNTFGAPAGAEISQWSLVFNDLCRQAATRGELTLRSSGAARRNFITMGDAVSALEFLAARQDRWPKDGLINVGSPIWLSISEVADIVAARAEAVLGKRPKIASSAPPEPVAPQPIFSLERLTGMGFEWTADVEREVDDTLRLCRDAGIR